MEAEYNHLNHAMKGKSSIWIAQNVERKMRNFMGTNSGLADTL